MAKGEIAQLGQDTADMSDMSTQDHPYVRHCSVVAYSASRRRCDVQGFFAKPQKDGDSLNLLIWDVGIPGKEGVSLALQSLKAG